MAANDTKVPAIDNMVEQPPTVEIKGAEVQPVVAFRPEIAILTSSTPTTPASASAPTNTPSAAPVAEPATQTTPQTTNE